MGNKLLIADDSKMVISLVRSIFENQNEGYSVIAANDGSEAIKLALKESPNLILMDWQMPEMSGIEALKKLKKSDKTKEIPVIMLTATESSAEAFEAGACDLIPKPFNKNELVARVKNIIELVNYKAELKKKTIEVEIQSDKLKLQKEILIRQKKEISEELNLSSRAYTIVNSDGSKINSVIKNSFLLSLQITTIPSNFLWEWIDGNNLFFCIGFLPKENVASFIYTSAINACLTQFIIENSNIDKLQPSSFIDYLQKKLLNILDNSNDNSKKLLDIVFCQIDLKKKTLFYSGINLPVFVIKNDKLVELKTDKSVQGFISKNAEFTNHKVQLSDGDLLYILNDGFNENRFENHEKSFISEEISSLLMKIYKKEFSKHKHLFEKTFESWKNDLKQQSDILVFGMQL